MPGDPRKGPSLKIRREKFYLLQMVGEESLQLFSLSQIEPFRREAGGDRGGQEGVLSSWNQGESLPCLSWNDDVEEGLGGETLAQVEDLPPPGRS